MCRTEETLRTAIAYCGRRCRAPTCRQTRARWDHGQIARHHARTVQLLTGRAHRPRSCSTEVSRIHRRHGSEDMIVADIVHVREAVSAMQRRNAAEAIDVRDVDVGDVDHPEAATVPTPPRMEPVARSHRKPAKAAPAAITKTETPAAAPAPERY